MPLYNISFEVRCKRQIQCDNEDILKEIVKSEFKAGKYGKIKFGKIEPGGE